MASSLDIQEVPGSMVGDVCAVIVAAGRGRRMNTEIPKPYLPLAGKPLLVHTIRAFVSCPDIDRIVAVVAREDFQRFETGVLPESGDEKPLKWVEGGQHRGDSVYSGLAAAGNGTGLAVIHDGARPLIRPDQIGRVVSAAKKTGACFLAAPAFDTLKRIDDDGRVSETLDRSRIWLAQTPQAFHFERIWEAHQKARRAGLTATDDAQLVERMHFPVYVVEGDAFNPKITTARDLQVAEALLGAAND